MQILNCAVRHLLGRERQNAHWSTSAYWASLASAIGDRVSDRIQVWKRDQQGRWNSGEKSDLAENQTGFYGQEVRLIIMDAWAELSRDRRWMDSVPNRKATQMKDFVDQVMDARTEKARMEIFNDVRMETKGPRYERNRPVGGDRVLAKVQLQLHQAAYKGVMDMLMTTAFDRYGGGGSKAAREAPLGTETLLWETGQLPRDMPSPRRGRDSRR